MEQVIESRVVNSKAFVKKAFALINENIDVLTKPVSAKKDMSEDGYAVIKKEYSDKLSEIVGELFADAELKQGDLKLAVEIMSGIMQQINMTISQSVEMFESSILSHVYGAVDHEGNIDKDFVTLGEMKKKLDELKK